MTLLHAIREGAEQRGAFFLGETEQAALGFTLQQFPMLGRAPSRHDIAQALNEPIGRIQTGLEQLDTRDLVYLDPSTKEIRIAYPFSSTPTAHQVEVLTPEGRQRVFAVCAIDALGISFLLRRDIAITSSCPQCTRTMTLEVHSETITVCEPATIVVWVGTDRRDHAATSVCSTMNFFCTDVHLAGWCARHQAEGGHMLRLGEALYLGKGLFEALLERADPGHRPQTGDQKENER